VRGFESELITIGTPKHQLRNLLRAQTTAYSSFSMAAHDNGDPVNLELAKEKVFQSMVYLLTQLKHTIMYENITTYNAYYEVLNGKTVKR